MGDFFCAFFGSILGIYIVDLINRVKLDSRRISAFFKGLNLKQETFTLIIRLFYLVLILFPFLGKAIVNEPIRFDNLNHGHGLSNDWVNSITEDDRGFMWVGTRSGLNVYDGNQNIVYRFDPKNENSISHNDVSEVTYMSKGYIFAGTWGGGLNVINSRTRQIKRVGNTHFERSLTIKSIVEDNESNIWIGTYGQGIFSYDFETNQLTKCANRKSSLLKESESLFCQDLAYHNDTLWIVTRNKGLGYVPVKTTKEVSYVFLENESVKIPNDLTHVVFIEDELYMGSYDGQVLVYDRSTFKTDTLLNLKLDREHRNRINSILQDKDRNLWMCSSSGIFKYSRNTKRLTKINDPETGDEYNDNYCSLIDSRGVFWMGNWGNGLYSYLNMDGIFHTVSMVQPNKNIIQCIQPFNDSIFLLGTNSGILEYNFNSKKILKVEPSGLGKINAVKNIVNGILPYKNKFLLAIDGAGLFLMDRKYRIRPFKNNQNSILFNSSIIGVSANKNGDRLIGTWSKGGVLINEKTNLYREFNSLTERDSSLQCNTVYCELLTSDGRTLIGTEGGIIEYDREKDTFKNLPIKAHINSGDKFIVKGVRGMVEDPKGYLWIASISGLVKYDLNKNNDEFILTEKDGLVDRTINNMACLDGIIWATTKSGLMKINTVTNKVANFTTTDGLSGNVFNDNGVYYKNGILYMANGYDMIYFEPHDISKQIQYSRLEFLDFRLHDRIVTPEDKVFQTHISMADEVNLNYNQNNVSFDVSVIDFNSNYEGKFAHKLVGFDDNWIPHDYSNTKIRYTNLEAGEYTLMLASILEDHTISDNVKKIKLFISPPFWKTWWFRALALILFVSFVAIYVRLRTRRVNLENKRLETEVVKRTTELSTSNSILKKQNKAIESNIRYASVLQNALLPTLEKIHLGFKEFFIFNRPKDGVSGDFFWFTKMGTKSIFVVSDCTGHGVSGAFVSVFGVSSLSSIIENNKITQPNLILNELHKKVISAFHQNKNTVKDGMDISVISFDEQDKTLEISSAKSSVLLVTGNQELIRVKGDQFPIGGSIESYSNRKEFTLKTYKIDKPSTLYLFSDGFQDQFGGKMGKKYMQRKFREFLFSCSKKDVNVQKAILEKEFDSWKGDHEQIDDVLVAGIRLE